MVYQHITEACDPLVKSDDGNTRVVDDTEVIGQDEPEFDFGCGNDEARSDVRRRLWRQDDGDMGTPR